MSNPLLDLIARGESGAAGYNAYNRGTYVDARGGKHIRGPHGAIDFSSLTVGQVSDRQHLRGNDPDRLFAVGKYQVIPATMDDAILKLGLDRGQKITPALQDRIFSEYLIVDKRPDIHGFITGQPGVTLEAAQRSLAQEWASFGDPDKGGASHYGGANHASITLDQSASTLKQMRASYEADLEHGLSPTKAWKNVTASEHSPAQTQPSIVPHASLAGTHSLLQQGSHSEVVRSLQADLTALGYSDSPGYPLRFDGAFGARTRLAVEAFQRDHHLTVDGKVGQDTRTALQAALQTRLTTRIDHACHPDHGMYTQTLAGVHHAEAQRDIAPGLHSERLAAALVAAAKSENLTRIDGVRLSDRGERAFVEQTGSMPGMNDRFAFVETEKAIHTTLAHSTAALPQANVAHSPAALSLVNQQHNSALGKAPASLPSTSDPAVAPPLL